MKSQNKNCKMRQSQNFKTRKI